MGLIDRLVYNIDEIFEKDLYEKMLKKNEGHKTYILHDGPPYANGEIHMGHALNKVLKDTVNRFKSLQGYQTIYVPGYDTHGLPTEKKAIQALGLNREELSVSQFRDTCRKFALEYVDKQTEGFKRLGVLGDWEHPYITLEPEFEGLINIGNFKLFAIIFAASSNVTFFSLNCLSI